MLISTLASPYGNSRQFADADMSTIVADPQYNDVIATGSTLAAQEGALRAIYAQLLPTLVTATVNNLAFPDVFLAYNKAAIALNTAATAYLAVRAQMTRDQLADPDAQIAVLPTFVFPQITAGFGRFADAPLAGQLLPTQSVQIKYGFLGEEITTTLSNYVQGTDASGQFGIAPLLVGVVELFVLLGVSVGLYMISKIIDSAKANADTALNHEATQQAIEQTKQATLENQIFQAALSACLKDGKTAGSACVTAATTALQAYKAGHANPSLVTSKSLWAWIGIVTVVGIGGATAYAIWKRKQSTHRAHESDYDE